jgi:2-keto-4-pentenoate hydratase/2-oxohepta-3-ene-1,7-dioic acid hydratase in catechol pathway
MKLLRWGEAGAERPGLVDENGMMHDLSGHIDDVTGAVLGSESLSKIGAIDATGLPEIPAGSRIGPCVGNIGKFLCIGLNYSDHAAETGAKLPEHPILFQKATSAVVGPNDQVSLPRQSKMADWEVELGVVIGSACKYATKDNALDFVAGYCIVNDVSEREFQKHLSGQWTKGKSCDTFGPTGPYLVTKDEVPNPQDLDMTCDISGVRRQTGNTVTMIFSVVEIIQHLSSLMTLHPGDVIATGTPPGVGLGIKPDPVFLKEGDVMELSITGLGSQRQEVVRDA